MKNLLTRQNFVLHLIFFLIILATVIVRIPILHNRGFDPDEFEHLHAARGIFHGMVIYRDFFEHHTPFIHFMLAPLYLFFGDSIPLIFAARWMMLIFTCGILYLTYLLTKKLYGCIAGLCAALSVSLVLIFVEKTIEIRPDVPEVCFWLLTLIFFLEGMKKWKRKYFILSGAMLSSAIMCSPKALFAATGFAIGLVWFLIDWQIDRARKERFVNILWIGVGAAIPIAIFGFYFLVNGALDDFIYRNFTMNLGWKNKFSPRGYIERGCKQNPFFCVLGIAGLILATLQLFSKKRANPVKNRPMTFMPVVSTYMLIWGLYLMPVPFRQYYLLFIPLLAMYCGMFITTISSLSLKKLKQHKERHVFAVVSVIGIYVFSVILIYALVSILNFSKYSEPVRWNSWKLYKIIWAICLSGIILAIWRNRRGFVALFFMVGICLYPFNQILTHTRVSNTGKLNEIRFIMENTTPDDTVLDGWTGSGVFRDHAYYYYFLHSGVRQMMTEKERSEDVLKALRENNTKIVIYDGNVRDLSPAVKKYVEANYKPAGIGAIYVRK